MSKEKVKKKTKKQDSKDEFLGLAKDLKEIVVNLNQRLGEVESLVNRVKERLGL